MSASVPTSRHGEARGERPAEAPFSSAMLGAIASAQARILRAAMPAGDPVSWGAITEGTLLDGVPYPHPSDGGR